MFEHWAAKTNDSYKPLSDFQTARATWTLIGELFPDLLASVLMPNHIHLLIPKGNSRETIYSKFGGVLGAVSKRSRVGKLWERLAEPKDVVDRRHLQRTIRYVVLNPCRDRLCKDPLEWYWSTHREVMGATVERPDMAARIAAVLGDRRPDFRARHHAYVSGDPSVDVGGTPHPEPAAVLGNLPKGWAVQAIADVLASASAALRVLPDEVRQPGKLRNLFIHFAARNQWRRTHLLADTCGVTPETVRLILRRPAPPGLDAAQLCLGDPRLRPAVKTGSPHQPQILR